MNCLYWDICGLNGGNKKRALVDLVIKEELLLHNVKMGVLSEAEWCTNGNGRLDKQGPSGGTLMLLNLRHLDVPNVELGT